MNRPLHGAKTWQLQCVSCEGYFSETHGTLFHGKRSSPDLIVRVIACLAEGLGIRGTALDDLTIISDSDPTISGGVEGTGILTLQQASNATTMGVAGGAGALNYSLADLAGLGANWTSLRLGSPTATGALTVGARAWDVPVDYRAAAAGSI